MTDYVITDNGADLRVSGNVMKNVAWDYVIKRKGNKTFHYHKKKRRNDWQSFDYTINNIKHECVIKTCEGIKRKMKADEEASAAIKRALGITDGGQQNAL